VTNPTETYSGLKVGDRVKARDAVTGLKTGKEIGIVVSIFNECTVVVSWPHATIPGRRSRVTQWARTLVKITVKPKS
jgi:hypothetical protein